jgi:hypothetical protein
MAQHPRSVPGTRHIGVVDVGGERLRIEAVDQGGEPQQHDRDTQRSAFRGSHA